MDGFRWDYFEKTETPNFDEIIKGGSKSKALIPVFPTKTFPNHISIVTGLYPENHGGEAAAQKKAASEGKKICLRCKSVDEFCLGSSHSC